MKVKHLLVLCIAIIAAAVTLAQFSTDSGQADVPNFLYSIKGDSKNGKLSAPTYVTTDDNGKVLVADSGNRRISVFTDKSRFLFEINRAESGRQFVYPYGLAAFDGKILVADTGAGAIYEFSAKGDYVKTWTDAPQGFQPACIFVTPEDAVYVTDLKGKQIIVFSKGGKLLRKIKPLQVDLGSPQGIAVNDDGTMWVADGANYNVKLLKSTGDLLKVFDGGPKWPVTVIKGLTLDKQGRIYVSDTLTSVIRVFDKQGNNLYNLGTAEGNTGGFRRPLGISIGSDNRIYIADQGNNRVQVWGWR